MKKLLLLSALFIFSCSYGQEITKEYYENGNLSGEGQVIDGLREGNWKAYYDTGEMQAEVNFIKGVINGKVIKYYKNGQIQSEGKVIYGSNEGETISYYENGNLYQKINFKNNKWHGDYQFYYANGNLMETGTFFEGRKKGVVKLYDLNGQFDSESYYKGNERTPQEFLNKRLLKSAKDLTESLDEYEKGNEKGNLEKVLKSLRWFAEYTYMNPLYSSLVMIVLGIIWYVIKAFKP